MSNIHGLSFDSNKNKNKNEEEFSVGGQTSSTAVLRPNNGALRNPNNNTNNNNNNPSAADIIKQAREQKASDVAEDKNIGLITLYSNGFIIGNGEFREVANNPRNQQFLAQLKQQEVPDELEAICKKEWGNDIEAVRVNLVDKSSETYTPPKPKFDFAQSKGQSIASGSNNNSDSKSNFSTAKPTLLVLNNANPSTIIQIQLADRKKLKETINQDATVMQLYSHIMHLSNRNTANFELHTGYPPKPLTQPNQTIKEAGLLGAQVIQK